MTCSRSTRLAVAGCDRPLVEHDGATAQGENGVAYQFRRLCLPNGEVRLPAHHRCLPELRGQFIQSPRLCTPRDAPSQEQPAGQERREEGEREGREERHGRLLLLAPAPATIR